MARYAAGVASRTRKRAEIEEARLRDPLEKLRLLLTASGALTDARDAELRGAARNEVNAATDAAEAGGEASAGEESAPAE